jgi:large subunit ribosomal protein L10
MNGKMLSTSEIKNISQLPSLDGIRGKLIGILQAPAAQLARVTNAYATKDASASEAA